MAVFGRRNCPTLQHSAAEIVQVGNIRQQRLSKSAAVGSGWRDLKSIGSSRQQRFSESAAIGSGLSESAAAQETIRGTDEHGILASTAAQDFFCLPGRGGSARRQGIFAGVSLRHLPDSLAQWFGCIRVSLGCTLRCCTALPTKNTIRFKWCTTTMETEEVEEE